jgi:hypothetical protein
MFSIIFAQFCLQTSTPRDLVNTPMAAEALSDGLSDGQCIGVTQKLSWGQFGGHDDGQRIVRRTVRPCKRYIKSHLLRVELNFLKLTIAALNDTK